MGISLYVQKYFLYLLGQQFHKYFYLEFCIANYQALVKVYKQCQLCSVLLNPCREFVVIINNS